MWRRIHTRRTPVYYRIDRLCLPRYEKVLCVSPDLVEQCRASGVRDSQPSGNLSSQVRDERIRMRLTNERAQRAAANQLHCDEPATLEFADLVDRDDVGMVQRGRCASFAHESLGAQHIVERSFREDL